MKQVSKKFFLYRDENRVAESQTRKTAPGPVVRWVAGDGAHLPKPIFDLARPRDGWTPQSWRDRLLQLAERCEGMHPARAAELRAAAEAMTRCDA